MKIPKEFLEEKNYDGTRLVEITDERVITLNEERKKRIKEGEPILKKMEEMSPELDAFYARLKPVEEEREKIKKEMQPAYDAYNAEVKKMEKYYQKGQAVANKMQPIINSILKDQMSEFEKATTLKEENGKLYVEIVDEIEEKVKAIRQAKQK